MQQSRLPRASCDPGTPLRLLYQGQVLRRQQAPSRAELDGLQAHLGEFWVADPLAEGADLGNLGTAYHALGQVEADRDHPSAIEYYQQALAIARAIDDRHGEGNRLGSVRHLTDASGQEVAGYSYYAFGAVRAASGSGDEWRFTGEQWDEAAGLYFLRARYYEPGIGRFVSADPFPGYAHLPQTQHRYVYVMNDPVNWVDPSGLHLCWGPTRCEEFAREVSSIIRSASNIRDALNIMFMTLAYGSVEKYSRPKDPRDLPCYGFKPAFHNNSHHYIAYLWFSYNTFPIPFRSVGIIEPVDALNLFLEGIEGAFGRDIVPAISVVEIPFQEPVVYIDPSKIRWNAINESLIDFVIVTPTAKEHGRALQKNPFRITDLPDWIRHEICDRLYCMEDDCCF